MLPKKNRADKKALDKIFKEGKFFTFPDLTFKFLLEKNSKPSRISFIVPKTVAKKAVTRNSLRRKGYIALEPYISQFPLGLTGAFVFKKLVSDTLIIQNEIKNILNKLN